MTTTPRPPRAPIGPDLRRDLVAMVRKRVPESDVEDIVQATLTEAIESPNAPAEPEQLRRWLFGVAKHKVVDFHRRRGRETFEVPELTHGPAPHVEADLLRWAEKNLPDNEESRATLDWMLREGEGEKLESIAASEKLPAPRVRQRVSRLRRHLKTNWQREVALLAAVGVVIGALVLLLRRPKGEEIQVDPHGLPLTGPEALRREGLERCARSDWRACLEKLDEAKRLDPAGDSRPEVQHAREGAEKALAPSPTTLPPPAPEVPPPDSQLAPPPPTAEPTAAPPSSASPSWDLKKATKSPAPLTKDVAPTKPVGTTPAPVPAPAKPSGKPSAKSITSDSFGNDWDPSIGSGSGSGGGGKESAGSGFPSKSGGSSKK